MLFKSIIGDSPGVARASFFKGLRSQLKVNILFKGVFTWWRASPLYRDPVSQLNSLSKGQPSLATSRYWLPRSRLGGLEIFHINALERASKSKLRTHDKSCLDQHFLDNFSFHKLCLCVGYKMKTCTQISDSGFRGKINVVSLGDSAEKASPCRRADFSHVNVRWNPALLHVNTP